MMVTTSTELRVFSVTSTKKYALKKNICCPLFNIEPFVFISKLYSTIKLVQHYPDQSRGEFKLSKSNRYFLIYKTY